MIININSLKYKGSKTNVTGQELNDTFPTFNINYSAHMDEFLTLG